MNIEDSEAWKNPHSIRIDLRQFADHVTLTSVDFEFVVRGKNVEDAFPEFITTLVEVRPEYGGTRRDVLFRMLDGAEVKSA